MQLEYNITKEQYALMSQAGICNGIGGEGQNIEGQIFALFSLIPGYDPAYGELLMEDFRSIAREHDIQFFLRLGFYWSNFKLACKLYRLTKWGKGKRFIVACIAFHIVNTYGKKFYYL